MEEIAHLYFSTSVTAEKRARAAEAEGRVVPEPSPRKPGTCLVCCTAGRTGGALAIDCLYNLAVLLQVSDGPVLIAGSGEAWRRRFSFQFRPDRERFFHGAGPELPSGIRGPMDIRLSSVDSLSGMVPGRRKASPGKAMIGAGDFHYILSDELSSADHFNDLPGTVLFVVTPRTTPDSFDFSEKAPLLRTCSRNGHAGVVTAGVKDKEGADDLFQRWAETLGRVLPDGVRVENFGRLQEAYEGGPGGSEAGLRVLEAPGSPETRRLLAIASRIRRRRSGLMPGLFPGYHSREGLYRELLKCGAFRSPGESQLTVSRQPGVRRMRFAAGCSESSTHSNPGYQLCRTASSAIHEFRLLGESLVRHQRSSSPRTSR